MDIQDTKNQLLNLIRKHPKLNRIECQRVKMLCNYLIKDIDNMLQEMEYEV
jgi:hypothetical protein